MMVKCPGKRMSKNYIKKKILLFYINVLCIRYTSDLSKGEGRCINAEIM